MFETTNQIYTELEFISTQTSKIIQTRVRNIESHKYGTFWHFSVFGVAIAFDTVCIVGG
jgi:hypothetical protein